MTEAKNYAAKNSTRNPKILKETVRSIVESLSYECVGIDITDGKAGTMLRIYIDKPEGVAHTDCVDSSRAITEYFDRCEEEGTPWFNGKYFIEVSSPGLERPLYTTEHYRRFIGKRAQVMLADRRKITADIAGTREGDIIDFRMDDGTSASVSLDEIKRANLVFVLEKGEKKGGGNKQKK